MPIQTSVGYGSRLGTSRLLKLNVVGSAVVPYCIVQPATYGSMSARNKRSAESEEVSRKKKPRKDDDDSFDEDDSASEINDDELEALDQDNVIPTGRRTRGIRVDYTKAARTDGLLVDDESGSEPETKGATKTEETVKKPSNRSPERKPANIEELDDRGEDDEGGEDEGEEDGQDEEQGDEDDEADDDD
ncbi:hypothetical protein EI94DRAFT_1741442 [Lactarius quietus]|nr:hypothetical protein EI94DRAFT_1741442 [Lactarius quietus]